MRRKWDNAYGALYDKWDLGLISPRDHIREDAANNQLVSLPLPVFRKALCERAPKTLSSEFMYAYISGQITMRTPTMVVIESAGVGYEIQISLYTFGKIEQAQEAKLWTQLIVREDSHTLYGFFDPQERTIFNHLISVSGIGPNTARLILSGMTPADVESAILSEDEVSFNRVKGVGPKTAKRVIVDLKDRIIKTSAAGQTFPSKQDNRARREALSALIALGYSVAQAQKALTGISAKLDDKAETETWIKLALQDLTG